MTISKPIIVIGLDASTPVTFGIARRVHRQRRVHHLPVSGVTTWPHPHLPHQLLLQVRSRQVHRRRLRNRDCHPHLGQRHRRMDPSFRCERDRWEQAAPRHGGCRRSLLLRGRACHLPHRRNGVHLDQPSDRICTTHHQRHRDRHRVQGRPYLDEPWNNQHCDDRRKPRSGAESQFINNGGTTRFVGRIIDIRDSYDEGGAGSATTVDLADFLTDLAQYATDGGTSWAAQGTDDRFNFIWFAATNDGNMVGDSRSRRVHR